MPANLPDFADDTAFERYILDRATPLLPRSQESSIIELGEDGSCGVAVEALAAVVQLQSSDSFGSTGDQLSRDDIRPLLFGAAWKVLDLLCELCLEQAGVPYDTRRGYLIDSKVTSAASGSVAATAPFVGRSAPWTRIMNIYASTKELRHSLVYRRLVVDPGTGTIAGVGTSGQPNPAITPVTSDEQAAFCQAAVVSTDAQVDDGGVIGNAAGHCRSRGGGYHWSPADSASEPTRLRTGPAHLPAWSAIHEYLTCARPHPEGGCPGGAWASK